MVQRIGVRVGYKVHRLAECNKNKRKTNEERWHVTPFDGGIDSTTVSWGRWTLALIDVMIGTNEPSIVPTTLAKPAIKCIKPFISIDRHFVSVTKKTIQWSNIGI